LLLFGKKTSLNANFYGPSLGQAHEKGVLMTLQTTRTIVGGIKTDFQFLFGIFVSNIAVHLNQFFNTKCLKYCNK